MALPTVNWRYCAPVTLAANTTVGILDALYTAGTAATYNDGTARTPGTGSAWTWNRDTSGGVNVASYGVAPLNPLSMSYIVAGATVLPGSGPTMISPDSNAINRVNIGMNRSSGAYAGWNLAAPFTSGLFSGYGNACPATTSVTYATLYYWECQESFVVQLVNNVGTAAYGFAGGALVDPLSASSVNAESDGRVYSFCSTGNTSAIGSTWISSLAATGLFNGGNVANVSRFYQFVPGSGAVNVLQRIGTSLSATTLVSPNGEFPAMPAFHYFNLTSKQYMGALRQVVVTRAARTGQRWANGGVTVGYIYGTQPASDAQCCALLY
jgi:hypothetical protein